jgi:hypothetical protein
MHITGGASTNSSGLCAHIVVVNTFRYAPVTFTLRVRYHHIDLHDIHLRSIFRKHEPVVLPTCTCYSHGYSTVN